MEQHHPIYRSVWTDREGKLCSWNHLSREAADVAVEFLQMLGKDDAFCEPIVRDLTGKPFPLQARHP